MRESYDADHRRLRGARAPGKVEEHIAGYGHGIRGSPHRRPRDGHFDRVPLRRVRPRRLDPHPVAGRPGQEGLHRGPSPERQLDPYVVATLMTETICSGDRPGLIPGPNAQSDGILNDVTGASGPPFARPAPGPGGPRPAATLGRCLPLRVALCQINTVVGDLDGNCRRGSSRPTARPRPPVPTWRCSRELAVTGYPPEDLLLKPGSSADSRAALARLAGRAPALRRGGRLGGGREGAAPRPVDGPWNAAAVLHGGRMVRALPQAAACRTTRCSTRSATSTPATPTQPLYRRSAGSWSA